MATITAHEKWKCAEREVEFRRRAYPRWINDGRLTHREARYQLDVMAAIAADYRELAEKEEQEGRLI